MACPISESKEVPLDFQQQTQLGVILQDKEIQRQCASGGAAMGFYYTGFELGYNAIGTCYDTAQNRAVTRIAESFEDALSFRGSKYIQGDHTAAISKALRSEASYVAIGLPCEIYGLKRAASLMKVEDKFIFIDLFCHGIPSYLAWDKYLMQKNGSSPTRKITFRDHEHGWHKNVLTIENNRKIIQTERSKDGFYHVFDDGYLCGDCCVACNMCQRYGHSDIRIGDLWDEHLCSDGQFRSLVCIGTEKGARFWEKAEKHFDILNVKINLVARNALPPRFIPIRQKAFHLIKENDNIDYIVKKYRRMQPLRLQLSRNKTLKQTYQIIKRVLHR